LRGEAERRYRELMDIQTLSMDMAQAKVTDQVGTAVLAKSIKGMDEEGAELLKILDSAGPLPEGSGGKVDLLA
jgi:hypothetical protein